MGIITKVATVKWHPSNKKYYEELGYTYTKLGEEFEVKIEDLPVNSHSKIICECDNCKTVLEGVYQQYSSKILSNLPIYCRKCSSQLYGNENYRKSRLKNSKSFYDWCIENNRQDVLDRWDYELNGCSPKDIGYKSGKKYWFKCDKRKWHKSEMKRISDFTSGHEGSIGCKQCNSIAQYILDTFPDKKLEEVWDFEKNNELDPWTIEKGKNKKCWFICQEKDYHGSYDMTCNNFSKEHGCPYCRRVKVHAKDSLGQYIIDNYGEEFLWKIWSDKNEESPFEIAPRSTKKVWWRCLDNKHKDYIRTCGNAVEEEFRCYNCTLERNESLIEEKVRLYLQELGYEVKTEYECSLIPKNPKTNRPLPFDNEIILENGKHLIVEVHGEQHYKTGLYESRYNLSKKEAKKLLYEQQLRDEYKKMESLQLGYYYLAISYKNISKNNKYKQIINNKIQEILGV